MNSSNPYGERRFLRQAEKIWSRLEAFFNRLFTPEFNPFYHLGTLGIYLLVVLTITGLYLTIFYRPGTEQAYITVEQISDGWFGSLMRSIHRYASDAFLLVVLLHALKTFISDRFWGSRWLAWLSGWGMVLFAWFIGTMGYWLVWDQRAQWLTEYLIDTVGGAVALTFIGPNTAATTFAAFVIVLFVHIFLPLSLLGLIIVHILRLARPRVWSPRWVMLWSTAGLVAISVVKPAISAAPADLSQLIESVGLDAWYLGFLPLLDRWGGLLTWGLAAAAFIAAGALPWISKGKDIGPAFIENPNCSGCALCSAECPYRAIEMHYRSDDHERFKSIAVINPNYCTGCGLCVGTCATLGVEMSGLATERIYENGLLAAMQRETAAGSAPAVVFTCQRHGTLGSLAAFTPENRSEPVSVRQVDGLGPVVSVEVACLGMVDVDWVKEAWKSGASDVVMLGCPFDDCNYREGPLWSAIRLSRRKALLRKNLHWIEAAPGDQRPLAARLAQLSAGVQFEKPELPNPKQRFKRLPGLAWAAGLLLFFSAFFFASAIPVEFPAGVRAAAGSELRLAIEHSGVVMTSGGQGMVLPEGATVDPSQILGGERFPVEVRLTSDGELVLEEAFEARGLRNEGEIDGFTRISIAPGTHLIEIMMRDDGEEWRSLFQAEVDFSRAEAVTFIYDQSADLFSPFP
jgi:ferredoxin